MQRRIKGRGDNNADKESMWLEPCEWLHSVKPGGREKSSSALPSPKVSLSTTVHLFSVITCKLTHTCICSCTSTCKLKHQCKVISNLQKPYFFDRSNAIYLCVIRHPNVCYIKGVTQYYSSSSCSQSVILSHSDLESKRKRLIGAICC